MRPRSYFTERGFRDQHTGGQAFAHEEAIMNWIFSRGSGGTIPEELKYIPESRTSATAAGATGLPSMTHSDSSYYGMEIYE